MTGYRVLATLHLKSTDDGGLATPLPAGTRSLLLRFPAVGDEHAGSAMLGAALTPRNADKLAPGHDVDADVLFWADEARLHATAGAAFDLWYGRPVGSGTVTGVADDLEEPP